MYQVYNITSDIDLESLSSMLNISLDELKRINKFIPDKLFSGDSIVIPFDDGIYMNYVVKKGDNLYNIADIFNQDINNLYLINGIKKGDYIYPGQSIMIPKENVSVYVTKDGDSIDSVSKKMGISNIDLISENKDLYLVSDQLIINKRV